MKTRSFTSVTCCAALLLMTVPVMAPAASKNLLLTDAEPQYASRLCWAAAEVLAVNQFYPQCPAPPSTPPTTPVLSPTSQGLEAGYYGWYYSHTPPPPPTVTALSWYLPTCEGNIQGPFCNDWGSPQLNGLTFKWGKDFVDSNGVHDPDGLNWDAMTQEINNGHPVLFKWGYLSDGTGTTPVAKHQLVVIGYSDDSGTQQLQIWDPLPVPDPLPSQVPACGPASGVPVTSDHNRTIPFSTYRTPVSDMGVRVTALHDKDQWALAMVVPNAPHLTVEEPLPPLPPPPPFYRPPPQLSLARALSMARPLSRQLDLQVAGAAPRTLGVPFPIVGLGFQQLLGALHDPTSLLTGTTSAILFPVESQGEVVDAFLLLFMEGRWQRGGYANIGITRRMVDVRALYAKQQHVPLESLYMVSVPGEVAFFAAYGKGKQAILIPASTDPTIDAVAGKPVLADKQLRKLTFVILTDLQRYRGRPTDTVRPRPQ
jgi:Peptidase_C39 like family